MTKTMTLENKNIIITGATSGLGVEISAALSSHGANVFLGGRREAEGEKVAQEIGGVFHKVNVADKESNMAFFEAAKKHFPDGVDAVLLNAGVEGNMDILKDDVLDIDNYDFIYNINVRGVILGFKYGTPLLRKDGKILATSSAGSIVPFAGNPIYASSKAAVDSLVKCYDAKLKDQAGQAEDEDDKERWASLKVNGINPTAYKTAMLDRFMGPDSETQNAMAKAFNPCGRVGQAYELASIVLQFVQGDLPYQSGDSFIADADTHFPLAEYFGRMAKTAN